ncbi:hypothetical protein TDB9533_00970 [Thalassocella blandensis]|nr:hypothetical protein TDB9533_00970 [Thalassocella blandensis]
MYRIGLVVVVFFMAGCSALLIQDFNQRFGEAVPAKLDSPPLTGQIDYWHDVKPILDNRCVVCHACYDAPCQLKLTAYDGLARGASKDKVYDASRVLAQAPSRLFEDAFSTPAWREKGFFPVLNERANTPQANIETSVLAQMLLQKQAHPLPDNSVLYDTFDLSLNRDQQCVNIAEYPKYKEEYPLWGMPYGFPGVSQKEHATLMAWLQEGMPYQAGDSTIAQHGKSIDQWEAFLNQDSLKAQLMSRYIYEHLFAAHIYFKQDATPAFFELVRSSTPPGQQIQGIFTRMPFMDPEVERVYYRFRPVQETIVNKTHLPYLLDEARQSRWQKSFLESAYEVSALPSYDLKIAANPFKSFAAIPTDIRYRFLLDEAQFTIMNFIKGSVCRGQTALNVIHDYFWVVFVKPEIDMSTDDEAFMENVFDEMNLPAEHGANAFPTHWLAYAEKEKDYRNAKIQYLNENAVGKIPLDFNLIWHGEGENKNASLTVYRHFDSATVVKGLQGETPQSAWIITYPLLERIHYLLVAGFDVFGNLGHQLNTRIYMDFLRMEGEENFLALLPKGHRQEVLDKWYRGAISPVAKYIKGHQVEFLGDSEITYHTDNRLQELYGYLKDEMKPVAETKYEIAQADLDKEALGLLASINQIKGLNAAKFPQTMFLVLEDDASGKRQNFTIIHHNAYTNISHLFGNEDRRLKQEDGVSVLRGLVGAYPNVFLHAKRSQLANFTHAITHIADKQALHQLVADFGVRRTNKDFWQFSDYIHASAKEEEPVNFGIYDYNRVSDL